MTRSVYFTGGGSGGHVVPARTLITELTRSADYEVNYIGGAKGVEAEIMPPLVKRYYGISTGKLRRYFSVENFIDLLRVAKGIVQSLSILVKAPRDSLVFSFGGFVSIPPVLAAKVLGIEVFVHEQTTRAGLANKIAAKVATKVFLSFESSKIFYPPAKCIISGYPIRERIFNGPWSDFVSLDGESVNLSLKPTIFVTGGGNGAECLNRIVADNLERLLPKFQIVHQVGAAHIQKYKELKREGYYPVAFVGEEIIDLMKFSAVVVARAGAGTVSELIALGKRAIYIPLAIAQKNEQYHNAIAAKELNDSVVIEEKDLAGVDWPSLFSEVSDSKEGTRPVPNQAREILLESVKKRNWRQ